MYWRGGEGGERGVTTEGRHGERRVRGVLAATPHHRGGGRRKSAGKEVSQVRETSVRARGRARGPRENNWHAVLLAAHGGEREGTGHREHSGETGKTPSGGHDKTAGPSSPSPEVRCIDGFSGSPSRSSAALQAIGGLLRVVDDVVWVWGLRGTSLRRMSWPMTGFVVEAQGRARQV